MSLGVNFTKQIFWFFLSPFVTFCWNIHNASIIIITHFLRARNRVNYIYILYGPYCFVNDLFRYNYYTITGPDVPTIGHTLNIIYCFVPICYDTYYNIRLEWGNFFFTLKSFFICFFTRCFFLLLIVYYFIMYSNLLLLIFTRFQELYTKSWV